jgi:hypothetical protein
MKHHCPMCGEQWNEDVCGSCGWFEGKQARYSSKPSDRRLFVGEVIALAGRHLRVSGMPDGVTICRDHRKRVAVRNFATNRLSYIPEWRLLKAK